MAEQVPTLWVTSPQKKDRCAGVYKYRLQVNGQPMWMQRFGLYYIYSGTDGRWHVVDSKEFEHLEISTAFCTDPHEGLLPHQVKSGWMRVVNKETLEAPDFKVEALCSRQAQFPNELRLVSPVCQPGCGGAYLRYGGFAANGMPVWKQLDGPGWLYSASNGFWSVGNAEARDSRFVDSKGWLYTKSPHGGLMPHEVGNTWRVLVGDDFQDDPSVWATTPPGSLYVVSPHGERVVEGEYRPLPDREENSRPVWRQVGGDCWIFYGKACCWVISSDSPANLGLGCVRAMLLEADDPDEAGGVWRRLDGERWAEDPAISVAASPRALQVVCPNGQQACAGEYRRESPERLNGHPVWAQRGGEHWLFSGPTGRWTIGKRGAMEVPPLIPALLSCTRPHGGSSAPHCFPGCWQRLQGGASTVWLPDPGISVARPLRGAADAGAARRRTTATSSPSSPLRGRSRSRTRYPMAAET